jgi:hypothetical protein
LANINKDSLDCIKDRMGMRRNHPEHDLQCAIVQYCDVRHWPILAIPNGGFRFRTTAGMLKAEGVRRGIPDLLLPVARRGYHGFWIECKSPTGQPSRDQQWWILELAQQGYRTEVHRDLERAINALNWYMGEAA